MWIKMEIITRAILLLSIYIIDLGSAMLATACGILGSRRQHIW